MDIVTYVMAKKYADKINADKVDKSDLTASDNVSFRFGKDATTGKYGYILNQGGADTVIPFKSCDVTIDGTAQNRNFSLKTNCSFDPTKILNVKLPYSFYTSSVVIYNNEMHVLGGTNDNSNKHYKWNGSEWVSVSTLPGSSGRFCKAIVYNNEIHIFNRLSNHYKWDGTNWTEVSTLPYYIQDSGFSLVVYNDELHMLGGTNNAQKHYKWNGTNWAEVSTIPYPCSGTVALVYNNELHLIGSNYSGEGKRHYKWNGTSWSSVSTLPYDFAYGAGIVYNNEIYILGSVRPNYGTNHYKWDGTNWTSVSTLPYAFSDSPAIIYNNKFYIFSGTNEADRQKYYIFDGIDTWNQDIVLRNINIADLNQYLKDYVNILPINYGRLVVVNNKINMIDKTGIYEWDGFTWTFITALDNHIDSYNSIVSIDNDIYFIGVATSAMSQSNLCYKWDGTNWEHVFTTLPIDMDYGCAIVLNNEIHILMNTSHYKWNGTSWVSISTLPYSFRLGCCAIAYNNEIHILGGGTDIEADTLKCHYKWDGTNWSSVSTLPYDFFGGTSLVYNNEIHILGGHKKNTDYTKHYKLDETNWSSVSTLPSDIGASKNNIVYNNEIHLLGNYKHYKFIEQTATWEQILQVYIG